MRKRCVYNKGVSIRAKKLNIIYFGIESRLLINMQGALFRGQELNHLLMELDDMSHELV